MSTPSDEKCACGEVDCDYLSYGYPYCRAHSEHHRPPECPVSADGFPMPWWLDGEPDLDVSE